MHNIVRTTSSHPDFISLVEELDEFLAHIDGDEHAFYNQLNKTTNMKTVVIAYEQEQPVGCGAIREFDDQSMEVKRMYTLPSHRGKGIAKLVLQELEKWASELGYRKCILETGKRQPEAIALYERSGYQPIPNYGKYLNVENSVCFAKYLG